MRPAVLPLLVLLAAGAVPAADDPGPALIAEARLVPGALEVMVANRRPAAVSDVTPEIVYQHRTLRGSPATIEPGGSNSWSFDLPPALRPGAAAAVIRVRTEGLSPAAAAPVIIALVATPGTAPAAVRATFDAAAVTHTGRAEVRLANPGTTPVDGRVVFVLPDGLATDPQTRPARIAPAGDASVTLGIENRGSLPPGTYAGYALFEYVDGDEQQTAMAKALITVAAPPGSESFPLVVGGLALLAAVAILGVAVRSSARRGPAAGAVALALGLGLAAPAHAATATSHRPARPAAILAGEARADARGAAHARARSAAPGEIPRPVRAGEALRGPAVSEALPHGVGTSSEPRRASWNRASPAAVMSSSRFGDPLSNT